MKKFQFGLDRVLDYRQRILEGRQNEYATATRRVQEQQAKLDAVQERYQSLNNRFREEAAAGVDAYFRTHAPDSVTAFLCMSDMLAIGAMEAVKSMGCRVPADYSIVGYDGLEVTNYTDPKITTVDQNIKKKGYEAARLLYDMLHGIRPAQKLVLPHTLVERGSVQTLGSE